MGEMDQNVYFDWNDEIINYFSKVLYFLGFYVFQYSLAWDKIETIVNVNSYHWSLAQTTGFPTWNLVTWNSVLIVKYVNNGQTV